MNTIRIGLVAGIVGSGLAMQLTAVADAKAKEKVLYSFCSQQNCTDGATPLAGLLLEHGMLFGTTSTGGSNDAGAVFSIDLKSGAEKLVYSFGSQTNCADGCTPMAGLIDVKGTLYGTTDWGGTPYYYAGTVFAVDPQTGVEQVLHSFGGYHDGENPQGGLISVKDMLYGTTYSLGSHDYGALFSLDRSTGTEKVLYSFCGEANCADGSYPIPGVIDVNGTLYGTTVEGGAAGVGTVFTVNRKTGTEKVIYSFCSLRNCSDGEYPIDGLIYVNGMLYGTTQWGGSSGLGTVFALDPATGAETVLYSFAGGTDGEQPTASLIDVNGTFYGTTQIGGAHNDGVVFSVDPTTGAEKVLHTFCSQQNCVDGSSPRAGLINVKGKLYGTTQTGGAYGYGTVFLLKDF